MSNLSHPGIQLEDTLVAFLEYADGGRGVVQGSTALWPGIDVRIELHGENGTATMAGEAMSVWTFKDERPEDDEIRAYGSAGQTTGAGGATDFGHHDHRTVIQDLIEAVNEDREPIIPTRSVRPTLEVALAMYQSAARGEPVDLPIEDDESAWQW